MPQSVLPPLSTRNDGTLGLIVAGETNIQNRDNPVDAFDQVRGILDGGDVRFLHLEGPLCEPSDDPQAPDIPHKARWRHSDPAMVRALTDAGIDMVSCASNVTYPGTAAARSAQVLAQAGMPFAGVGANRAEARSPAIAEHGGVRFGVLSFTSVFWPSRHAAEDDMPGTAVLPARTAYEPGRRALEMPGAPPEVVTWVEQGVIDELQADIRKLAQEVDIVILSCHWGVSSSPEPRAYQRQIGRAAIEAGADIVVGHHPHVIQPIEFHQGKPIFFSLGNFVFDWPKMHDRHKDGMMLRFDIADGAVKRIRLVPVMRGAGNHIGALHPGQGNGARIADRIRELSGDGIAMTIDGPDLILTDPAGN